MTGASGRIGSGLTQQLGRYRPGRVVGVSLDAPPVPPPDVVFHLAAQRDPSFADRAIHRTVSTAPGLLSALSDRVAVTAPM